MICRSAPKPQASINKTTSWKRGPRLVVRYLSTKSPVRIVLPTPSAVPLSISYSRGDAASIMVSKDRDQSHRTVSTL
jgi:hypothetical protein